MVINKTTKKVPDQCYDLGVKGHGQICLKTVLYYNGYANSSYIFIFGTIIAYGE